MEVALVFFVGWGITLAIKAGVVVGVGGDGVVQVVFGVEGFLLEAVDQINLCFLFIGEVFFYTYTKRT